MNKNRAAAEAEVYACLEDILPGSENPKIYADIFRVMSDEDFDGWIKKLIAKETYIAIIAPEKSGPQLSVANNLQVAKKWGHEFFERIWMDPKNGAPAFLSNDKYLVVDFPLKRQAQFLVKKISIPEDNRSIDNLTGQPTGKSKGAKISWPEVQIMAALGGFDNTIVEFIKFRGGDLQGFNAMNHSIHTTGGVSLSSIGVLGTRVKSVQSLSTLLTSMHLTNTLP